MNPEADEHQLDCYWVREAGRTVRRVGRSKQSGAVLIDVRYDKQEREVEKLHLGEDGELLRRIVHEYDSERKPKLTLAYDRTGKLIWRHKRGERPEDRS